MKKSKVKKNKKTASKKRKTAKKSSKIKVRTKRRKTKKNNVIKEESQKVKIRPKIEDVKAENAPLGIVFKLFVFLLIVSLNWSGAFGFSYTYAYFNDGELSLNNSLVTGTLDFSLRSGQPNFVPPEFASNLNPGQAVARDIYVKKEGSLPLSYGVYSEPVAGSCDLEFYNVLELRVWYNYYINEPSYPGDHSNRIMVKKYQGPLKDFDIDPGNIDFQIPNSIRPHFSNNFYGENEQWLYFQVVYPEEAEKLFEKSCEFKFVFEGEQIGGNGFSDQEEIYSTLIDGMLIEEETTPESVVNSGGGGVALEATEDSEEDSTTSEENSSSSQKGTEENGQENEELPDEELPEKGNSSSSQKEAGEKDQEEEGSPEEELPEEELPEEENNSSSQGIGGDEEEEEANENETTTSSSSPTEEDNEKKEEKDSEENKQEETPADLKEETEDGETEGSEE